MLSKDSTFSITFLHRGPDEKVLLFKHGDIPAKEESEADAYLSTKNADETEDIEKVIAAVKCFADAEEGSEETITRELRELEDEYGFTLEAVASSEDALDSDKEEEETDSEEEKEVEDETGEEEHEALETSEEEKEEHETNEEEDDEDNTSPFDIMKEEAKVSYTNPYEYDAYDNEELEVSDYFPVLSEKEIIDEIEPLGETVNKSLPNKD